MKTWRQSQILELVDKQGVTSQETLRAKLVERGIEATEATLSRDLKELGLGKRAGEGAYVRPGNERNSPALGDQLRRSVTQLARSVERVELLLVIKNDPGQAQGLAVLMDRSNLAEAAGTVAGDDTILIVCRGKDAAEKLEAKFSQMVK